MIDLVIVGAGPGGLAAAAAARARGLRPTLIERGAAVGGAWAHMRADLRCLSPRLRDHLPDGSIPQGPGPRATAGEVLTAIRQYATRADFDIRFGLRATGLKTIVNGFRLNTDAGPLETRRLVVATGEYGRPFRPTLSGEFGGLVQHSRDVQPEDVPVTERVLVVGGGNSGAELAVALARRGNRVSLSTRRPIVRPPIEPPTDSWLGSALWIASGVPIAHLPRRGGCLPRTPIVDPDLFEAIQAGAIRAVGPTIRLDAAGALTPNHIVVACDRIVFATGFLRETAWLGALVHRDGSGTPRHRAGISPEHRGLGFVGIPCMRTRRSGFLRGLVDDAKSVVGRLG